jgi:hypothetical protein
LQHGVGHHVCAIEHAGHFAMSLQDGWKKPRLFLSHHIGRNALQRCQMQGIHLLVVSRCQALPTQACRQGDVQSDGGGCRCVHAPTFVVPMISA